MDAATLLVILETLMDDGIPLHKLEIVAEDSNYIHEHSGYTGATVRKDSKGNYEALVFESS